MESQGFSSFVSLMTALSGGMWVSVKVFFLTLLFSRSRGGCMNLPRPADYCGKALITFGNCLNLRKDWRLQIHE